MNIETIVNSWIRASKSAFPAAPDGFFRFIAGWVALNAIYSNKYGSRLGDHKGAIKLANEPELARAHREQLNDSRYRAAVEVLAEQPVHNLKNGSQVTIEDVGDFPQVMEVVYQVRCNLFHGGKFPGDPRDQKLVEAAYAIIAPHLDTRYLRSAA